MKSGAPGMTVAPRTITPSMSIRICFSVFMYPSTKGSTLLSLILLFLRVLCALCVLCVLCGSYSISRSDRGDDGGDVRFRGGDRHDAAGADHQVAATRGGDGVF